MREIEVPKEFKKELQKFNLYCRATMDDRDISWDYNYDEEEDGLYLNWSDFSRMDMMGGIEHYFDEIINYIEKEYDDILLSETDCDSCTGSAALTIKYTPLTSTFEVTTVIYTQSVYNNNITKSFDELSKEPRPWYLSDKERLYQKLNDDSFITSIIDENDGETDFEMNFSGYGDSGSIDDNHYSPNIENLGYEMLDLYAAGFENDEGGEGTIYFDFDSKKMNLEYYQNYGDSFVGSREEIKLV
jgi:hypothetical protein